MRKNTPPPREFGFADEPFALTAETTADGSRLAAERAERDADRAAATRTQLNLLAETDPPASRS